MGVLGRVAGRVYEPSDLAGRLVIVGIGQHHIHNRRLAMLTIGLDVHQRTSTVGILDRNRNQVKTKTIRGHWSNMIHDRLADSP
jgi:hypothetical protein